MESASRSFFTKLCSVHTRRLVFLLVGLSSVCLTSGCAPYIAAELVFAGARAIAENAQDTPRSLGQTSATEDDNQQVTKERERIEAEKFQRAQEEQLKIAAAQRLETELKATKVASSAYAQSSLPACQGSIVWRWTNCAGTQTFTNGNKYVGEFKDGNFNGQGIEYRANGTIQAYVRVTAKAQVIPPVLKQVAHGPVFPSIGFDLKVQPLGSGIGVSAGGLDVADKAV